MGGGGLHIFAFFFCREGDELPLGFVLADLELAPDLEVCNLASYLGPSVCKSRSRAGSVSSSRSVPTCPSGEMKGEAEVEEVSEARRKIALGSSLASSPEIEYQYARNILALGYSGQIKCRDLCTYRSIISNSYSNCTFPSK